MKQSKINIKNYHGFIIFNFGLMLLILPGCDVPVHDSELWGVYVRTNEQNKEIERISKVHFMNGHESLFTPEGPKYHGLTYEMRYYFSGHHVFRKEISFLKWNDPSPYDWDIIAPVEETNVWVRVEGLCVYYQDRQSTNGFLLTVFTPQALLYQQEIKTMDWPDTNYLHFSEGNRVVTYGGTNYTFTYDVLKNNLYQTNKVK